jgi:arginine/lysine/ornithine decarboxylase
MPADFARIDVTEVEGTDDLHEPEGILLEAQQHAAKLCHAEDTFFLVGGSTAGILAAISAAVPRGSKILMSRASHRSTYHAVYLRQLRPAYLYGTILAPFDLCEAITPEEVRRGLEEHPDTQAVFLVSPTYEGRIADLKSIAEIVHAYGIPLIVDEAHGAHLGWSPLTAPSAMECGVDLAIQSTHKTLPAPTQTALLHCRGSLVDRAKLRRFLRIYQTSSPSYPLMAGIDNALRVMETRGEELLSDLCRRYDIMMTELSSMKNLAFLPVDPVRQDIGKLVISGKGKITGKEIAEFLREHGIETEMALTSYCLAMFTVGDTPEGFRRMSEVLRDLDHRLEETESSGLPAAGQILSELFTRANAPKQIQLPSESWDAEAEYVSQDAAEGRVAADFLYLYPPGTPILVPGEEIGARQLQAMRTCLQLGLEIRGLDEDSGIPVRM